MKNLNSDAKPSLKIRAILTENELLEGCRLGMDSHADMSCLGKHARILEILENQTCSVYPFNDSYAPMTNINVVNGAFALDLADGSTIILKINQALDFSSTMENSILCTNQSRSNNIIIDDVPKQFGGKNHAMILPGADLEPIPFLMHGPVSYLNVRYPSDDDLLHSQHYNITSHEIPWEPESLSNISSLETNMNLDMNDTSNEVEQCTLQSFNSNLIRIVSSYSRKIASKISPEILAKRWKLSLQNARNTLQSTTQNFLRKVNDRDAGKRFTTRAHQRQYHQLGGLHSQFGSDTFIFNVKSLRGNTIVQVFCNKSGFIKSYPLEKRSQAPQSLDRLLREVGVPTNIITDGAGEMVGGEWRAICNYHKVAMKTTEPKSPWQNPAEKAGGIVKAEVKRLMRNTGTPIRLWDYCWEYCSEKRSLTASGHINLDGRTPFEKVMGYTPDISEYTQFDWYEWIEYNEPLFDSRVDIGRWLGPAHTAGQGLAYWVLAGTGEVKMRSTVTKISHDRLLLPEMIKDQKEYSEKIEKLIGNYSRSTINHFEGEMTEDVYESMFGSHPDDAILDGEEDLVAYVDDQGILNINDHNSRNFISKQECLNNDQNIGIKVQVPHNDSLIEGTVVKRKLTEEGVPIGKPHDNPFLDTRQYDVELATGEIEVYTANQLAEYLYDQVDDHGRSSTMFQGITNHEKTEEAISKEDGWLILKGGRKKRKITSVGWNFEVSWSDGTSTWVPLKEIKNSNPVELAEYVRRNKLEEEPAFAWWVNSLLKKKKHIMKLTASRVPKKQLKFGIKVPSSVKEALQFDRENGNNFWALAIEEEKSKVIVAFEVLDEGEYAPKGSKRIPYHFVFDVKFDLTRKARLVAGGHRHKDVPNHLVFSSVASRESVRLAFMLASLNELDILAGDIGNAYLNAPNREKVHVLCGTDLFTPEQEGRVAVIVRALYGLKSAAAAWRDHFSSAIQDELKYIPCKADPDVYYKAKVKPDGSKYYAYLVIYVDDILCIDVNPKQTIDSIGELFRIKKGSVSQPSMYLGTDVRKWNYQTCDGDSGECYALGANSYINEAIKIVKRGVMKHELLFPSGKKSGKNPFSRLDYKPELDNTKYCDEELVTFYQNLIGILRWSCELGRVDILFETQILSQYMARPRLGHLEQAIHIFKYLDNHRRTWMVMDPCHFEVIWVPIKGEVSPEERARVMKSLYPDAVLNLPPKAPIPRGKTVYVSMFVDSDHASNKITRRSHTGLIIYVNMSPIIWYSKRQNSVESSTFSSEFVALRIGVELLEALVFKLQMLGVPVSLPCRVFCDNQAVVMSGSFPEVTLKKKNVGIAYHKVRESVASGLILIYYEKSESNIADLFTKILNTLQRSKHVRSILS